MDEIEFDPNEGIFVGEEQYDYFFKLVPWEDIAIAEGELAVILTQIVQNQKAIILNPAYTLMFQSKAFMKILWDLFPGHPLLLKTDYEPLEGKAYVEKPTFGREGENVTIYDEEGHVVDQKEGHYDNFKMVYQERAKLNRDDEGSYYQAGVFFAYEGFALGYRTGVRPILDDDAKFAGHIIV